MHLVEFPLLACPSFLNPSRVIQLRGTMHSLCFQKYRLQVDLLGLGDHFNDDDGVELAMPVVPGKQR